MKKQFSCAGRFLLWFLVEEYFGYRAAVLCGIACCYAQFKVPLSWELSVAVHPELVEGSLTSAFGTMLSKTVF